MNNTPKKFRTIADFLAEKKGKTKTKKINKWTEEDNAALAILTRNRSLDALRVKIYRLIKEKRKKK